MRDTLYILMMISPISLWAQRIEYAGIHGGIGFSNQSWQFNPEFSKNKERMNLLISPIFGASAGFKINKTVNIQLGYQYYEKGYKENQIPYYNNSFPHPDARNHVVNFALKYHSVNILADIHKDVLKSHRNVRYSFLVGPKIDFLRNSTLPPFTHSESSSIPQVSEVIQDISGIMYGIEAGVKVTRKFKKLGIYAGVIYSYDINAVYNTDYLRTRNNTAYLLAGVSYYFNKKKGCGCL